MTTVDRRALVGAAARRVPWVPVGATAAVCAAVVWTRALQVDAAVELVVPLRLSAVLLAATAAACLEDPAEVLTCTTPFGRFRRRCLSAAMTAAVIAIAWSLVVGVAAALAADPTGEPALPVGGLTIELLATCAVGWLLAASVAASSGSRRSGSRAAVAVVVTAILSISHPDVVHWLWVMPGMGAAWAEAHEHWTAVGLLALVGAGVLSRDPAARTVRWTRRV
jgi:hypothetical protein